MVSEGRLPIIPISIQKGDSYSSFWKIKQTNGTFYVPASNDSVIVGIKRNSEAKDYLIKKTYTRQDFINEGFYFTLSANETSSFVPSIYEYDIALKIKNAAGGYSFYHIISVSPFIVNDVVTLTEEE